MKNTPAGQTQTRFEKPNTGGQMSPDQIPHEIRNRAEYDHVVSILRADLEKTPEIAKLIQWKKNDVDLVNKLRTCTLTVGVVWQWTWRGHPQNWYTLLGRLAHFLHPKKYEASKWPIMASHLDFLLQEVMDGSDSAASKKAFQYSHSPEDCLSVKGHRWDGRITIHLSIADIVKIMDNQAAKVMQILIQTGDLTPKKAVEILAWWDKKEKIGGHAISIVAKLLSVPIEEVRKLLK